MGLPGRRSSSGAGARSRPETAQTAGFVWLFPLTFVSSAFVPPDTMPEPLADAYAWSLAFLALGIPFLMLLPMFGLALLGVGAMRRRSIAAK